MDHPVAKISGCKWVKCKRNATCFRVLKDFEDITETNTSKKFLTEAKFKQQMTDI